MEFDQTAELSNAPGDGAGGRGESVNRAYDQLRELIVHGRLAPGSRIIESDIADRLGLSRTPTRSALHRLQQEGYVVALDRTKERRLAVAPLTQSDAMELFQIVGQVEGMAARAAAERPAVERAEVVTRLRALNADLAAAGVTLLGEIGLGSVKAGQEAAMMVGWARKHGIQSTIHTGGPSIPGSGLIDEHVVLEADADVIGHVNGGHTSLSYKAVCTLCERSPRALEIVHNGNERIAILTARHAVELKCPHRVILGTDSPAGSGVQPLGILRMIALLSSLADIPAEIVFGFATGNTARMRGLRQGLVEVGRPADFVFLDRAQHTAGRDLLDSVRLGDIPGVGMVMIDGLVRCGRSRNTPPAIAVPVVLPQA
jgi:enamidase